MKITGIYLNIKSTEILNYIATHKNFKDAWLNCDNGDWLIKIARDLEIDVFTYVKAKALCANTVSSLMANKLSILAVDTAMHYADKKSTYRELCNSFWKANRVCLSDQLISMNHSADCAACSASEYDYDRPSSYQFLNEYVCNAVYHDIISKGGTTTDAELAMKTSKKDTANICRQVLTKEVYKILNLK